MPLQETSGAASYDAFGGGVAAVPNYIEDVFSTYLYTGNGSTQTITNGIDLSTKGGLVWQKDRVTADTDHVLCDTARGVNAFLRGNGIFASVNNGGTDAVYAFNTNGFSTSGTNGFNINLSGDATVSWTFRKQPKFFDVVTWTGSGANTTIAHNLGSVPGSIIIKRTDTTAAWAVYHRSLANTEYLVLNTTAAKATGATYWNSTTPTSTVFSLGTDATVNASGGTYVAYIFAHDAGGFGLTGTDNVISCGSYTGTGAVGNAINLGYEAQWVMIKRTDADGYDWNMFDVMRGMSLTGSSRVSANTSAAEINSATSIVSPTATGFSLGATTAAFNGDGATYIYIAIRRGPMKVPTTGTSVYQANTYTGNATANTTVAGSFGFPVDLLSLSSRDATAQNFSLYGQYIIDRLRGQNVTLGTATTTGETSNWNLFNSFSVENSIGWGLYGSSSGGNYMNNSGGTFVARGFRRAPSFFDEVCYTGTGSATTFSHNLGVAPELMIIKQRSGINGWPVYSSGTGNTKFAYLNQTSAFDTNSSAWNNTSPTSSVFTVGSGSLMNTNAQTYVAYLFATAAGVSKVGSYTGTATTKQIDCGFTGGARFVLIKRTDSTGDWYVWDSARGIVAGNDPYLLLNSTAAEVTNTDYVDTYSAGFEISSTAPAAINANGGSFIFFAVA